MQSDFEATTFRENFIMLNNHGGTCSPDLFAELLDTPDISSVSSDNSLVNLLIKSLKDEDPQIQGSAKAYIIYRLIKDTGTNEKFSEHLFALFDSKKRYQTSEAFLSLARDCHMLNEQSFKLCCQSINVYPTTVLVLKFNLRDWTDKTKNRLPQLFETLRELSSLTITVTDFNRYSNDDWGLFCKIISSPPNVSELCLQPDKISLYPMKWELLGEAFTSMAKLSTLDLTGMVCNLPNATSDDRTAFYLSLSKAPHLVSLNVSGCDVSLFNAWETFCNRLASLNQLKSLTLSDCRLSKLNATDWQHLSKISHLTTLELPDNFLGKDFEAWNGLCKMLISLQHLTLLNLTGNHFNALSSERGSQSFIPVLAHLKHLLLRGMDEHNDSLQPSVHAVTLFQYIQKSNLVSLDLSYSQSFLMRLDDDSFKDFCEVIGGAKNLSTLDLSGDIYGEGRPFKGISEARFKMLCEAIKTTHLSIFKFSHNHFPEEHISLFFESIANAKRLTTIDLSSSYQLNAEYWQSFWGIFNRDTTHLTGLTLDKENFDMYDKNTWSTFTHGLAEAKYLRSFSMMKFLNDNEMSLLLTALESLFNLIEFAAQQPNLERHPRIIALLMRNRLNSIASRLNSGDKNLTVDELQLAIENDAEELDRHLQGLPDTPDAKAFQETAQPILHDFYYAAASWFAVNAEPEEAINAYIRSSFSSKYFQSAREAAFSMTFQHDRNKGDSSLQAFPKALKHCMYANCFIAIEGQFKKEFDGFLLASVGLTNKFDLVSKITKQDRIKLLKYVSLLVLKEELERNISSTQTKFFYTPQIQQELIEKILALKPLSTLEELDAVGAFWANDKFDMAPFKEKVESLRLLCQAIELQGRLTEVTMSPQKNF